jgi:hypothetical protein
MGLEKLHYVQHRADFVRQKNGELLNERSAYFGSGLREIGWHEKGAENPGWNAELLDANYVTGFVFFANEYWNCCIAR